MGTFPYLDLAIGLSFVYLLLALACTSLNETLAGWLRMRAQCLDRGIQRLLQDPELKARIYKHPLISSMSERTDNVCPSYIPSRKFALALMDVLTGDSPASDGAALQRGISSIASQPLRAALTAVLNDTTAGLSTGQQKIEAWFNDGMDRVSGWYKRQTQVRILILATIVTLLANADTLKIVRNLWANPALRAEIVERAQDRLSKGRPEEMQPMVEYPNANDATEVRAVNVPDPITAEEKDVLSRVGGWQGEGRRNEEGYGAWLGRLLWNHLLGWVITILAVSLGAPFWFDMLNRFINIRNAGRAPDEPASKAQPNAPVPATAGGR